MLAASSDSVQSVVDEQAQQNEAALYAALLQQLASSNLDDQQKLMSALPDSTEIRPLPGFVIKTLTGPPLSDDSTTEPSKFPADCKVFINICHSPHLPSPPMATDEEIQQALEEQDNSRYRVPLSLSPPREDTDKAGKKCFVFDACINTEPLERGERNADFKLFLIELSMQWIEERHKIQLSREFTLLKMKSKGELVRQFIQRPRKPLIADANSKASADIAATKQQKDIIITKQPSEDAIADSELKSVSTKQLKPVDVPEYSIILEPEEEPEYLIITIQLPRLHSSRDCVLEVEAKRLLFNAPLLYRLDIELPVSVLLEDIGAQFDCDSRELTVTMSTGR